MTTRAARADLRSGMLLGGPEGETDPRLEELAAAAGEMLSTEDVCWDLVFGPLGASAGSSSFQDLVLIAAEHVYVVERTEGGVANMGVAERDGNIGLVISSAREEFRRL